MTRFGRKRASTARAGKRKRSGGESGDPKAGTPEVVPEESVIDGRTWRITVLPEAKPPAGRSKKTRYKMRDVEKEGNR